MASSFLRTALSTIEVSLFHLEAPCCRPGARRAGGRVGAYPPPHSGGRKRACRELRGGRVLAHRLRSGEGLFVIYLNRVARCAAHVRPVESNSRARAETRIRRGTDERRRGQRAGGRGCDGQRRRGA